MSSSDGPASGFNRTSRSPDSTWRSMRADCVIRCVHTLSPRSIGGKLQQARCDDELERFRLGFDVEHRALQERVELRRGTVFAVDGRPRPPLREPGAEAVDVTRGACGSRVGSTLESPIAPPHIRRDRLGRSRRVFELDMPCAEDDVARCGIRAEEVSLVEGHHGTVPAENSDGCAAGSDELGQEGEQTLHAIPQVRIVLPRLGTHSTHLLPPVDGNGQYHPRKCYRQFRVRSHLIPAHGTALRRLTVTGLRRHPPTRYGTVRGTAASTVPKPAEWPSTRSETS